MTPSPESPATTAPTPGLDAETGAPATAALAWVDPTTVKKRPKQAAPTVAPDLLSELPLRRSRAMLVPAGVILALVAGYVTATSFWSTAALPPTVSAKTLTSQAVPAGGIVWPAEGSAAVGIVGGTTVASTEAKTEMASITKVITVMTVLQAAPLAIGETGPSYAFTYEDSLTYWRYLGQNESSLPVPVDGSLTEYQMLQGILLGSAGNYTDRLVAEVFPSEDDFLAAANAWLASVGITDITIVEPTGIEYANVSTPSALIALGEAAMAHPVVAEIAAQKSADIPGAGLVENTNGIIDDAGVVGLKTGTLEGYNLLSAKNITVGDSTIMAVAVVLGQADEETRNQTSRDLYTQVESALQPQVALPAGTEVADVSTAWGATTQLVTASDASVVLWQRDATIMKDVALTDDRDAGASAGTISVQGSTGDATTQVTLTEKLDGPGFWWRLTHPLELFGLA